MKIWTRKPNTFEEIVFEKLEILQRMYQVLIHVFATQQFEVFKGCYFLCWLLEKGWKSHKLLKSTNFSTSKFYLGMIVVTPMGM